MGNALKPANQFATNACAGTYQGAIRHPLVVEDRIDRRARMGRRITRTISVHANCEIPRSYTDTFVVLFPRYPPSQLVASTKRCNSPSGQLITSAPLSVVKTTIRIVSGNSYVRPGGYTLLSLYVHHGGYSLGFRRIPWVAPLVPPGCTRCFLRDVRGSVLNSVPSQFRKSRVGTSGSSLALARGSVPNSVKCQCGAFPVPRRQPLSRCDRGAGSLPTPKPKAAPHPRLAAPYSHEGLKVTTL